MRRHVIVARLGSSDTSPVTPGHPEAQVTEIPFVDSSGRLAFGLGQVLDDLGSRGLRPSETSADLALLAAAITAADTRISRVRNAEDAWTREIELHVPVGDPALWASIAPLVASTLKFLTGDRWFLSFRPRWSGAAPLVPATTTARDAHPTSVCLFSGGLDSFIGIIDLLAKGETPILVSHWWDSVTSKHQTDCLNALKARFPAVDLAHVRAHVGFRNGTVANSVGENTLRGRSFLFFSLATMVADAIGGDAVVHVPENGFISLNVPLDPLRLGALSTRTTHPFYMARFGELLSGLGLSVRLHNAYGLKTKGQMAAECADPAFLRSTARQTMSCSSPGARRYDKDPTQRGPKHCGRCVPCLIRRGAIFAAWGVDDTEYRTNLHSGVLNTNRAEGNHVRSFELALSRLSKQPGRAKFDIHRPGPLGDDPNALAGYEAVYIAGLEEVGRLLAGVRTQPL